MAHGRVLNIVFLPGMDGTGVLFDQLMAELNGIETTVIPLTNLGSQDYQTLANYVLPLLPKENFILVAESFSGGIAAVLSQRKLTNLVGVIFVASFLSAPKPLLAKLASYLPVTRMVGWPLTGLFHRLLFLGTSADEATIARFRQAVTMVPSHVIKSRLRVISQTQYSGFRALIPAFYLRPSSDLLVSLRETEAFRQAFPRIRFAEIEGPHFIFQAKPQESAAALMKAIGLLLSTLTERQV